MGSFTRLEKIVILIIAVVLTSIFGYRTLSNNDKGDIQIDESGLFLDDKNNDKEDENENELFADDSNENGGEETPTHLMIHITGAVAKPGVVNLKNGDRVIDAIKKAGGLTSSADENRINLAQKLFDEDKVIIPSIGDNMEMEGANLEAESPDNTSVQSMVISGSSESGARPDSAGGDSGSGTININTASKSELETLPGIGNVTSDKIIDYRESTKFSSIEDIKNVSGIGEKKFEAIKSMITTR